MSAGQVLLAQAEGKSVSHHCFGSAVLFAAGLHLAASLPNTEMMEPEENPNPLKSELVTRPFEESVFFVALIQLLCYTVCTRR